ncbi:MAG TPA: thiol reductase thioredoxin, partial [Candidatus Methanoperedenaceae archaeon]|nr:thiol reductase thioredoxin [Candidatus Methanoperedenaceae archaeon]
DFFAEWCGPCKMQDPILAALKKKFEGRVEFQKVDIDKNYKLAVDNEIQAVPTLMIKKDDRIIRRYVGVQRADVLEADLNDALK